MTTTQLGLGYSHQTTESFLRRLKIRYQKSQSPSKQAAEWIADGYIVGWFQGRAETGPRALGGRSILADPTHHFNLFRVNDVKQRQPWRPLAPSILEEEVHDYVESPSSSPFMILSFSILPEMRSKIPAVCHTDGSARVQTVEQESCQPYHKLLSHLGEQNGIPIVLNTSFNLRGEPIVQHPIEAIRDFILTGIDRLIIDCYIIKEKPQINSLLKEALTASPFIVLYQSYLENAHSIVFLEHDRLTNRQRQQKLYLQAILKWLEIEYRNTSIAEFESVVSTVPDRDVTLISLTPYLDEEALKKLPESFLHNVRIAIVDYKMFMVKTSAFEFLEMFNRNRQELHRLIGQRDVVLWADSHEFDDIAPSLNLLGIHLLAIITSKDKIKTNQFAQNMKIISPDWLIGKHESVFLVVSFSVIDRFSAQLRQLGYHSGNGYLIWGTQYA